MRGLRVLAIALALAVALMTSATDPAFGFAYKPEIEEIDGPVAGGTQLEVKVEVLGTEGGERLTLQVREKSSWRTVQERPAPRIVGTQTFQYTAPNATTRLRFRALLTKGDKRLSTSKTRSVDVWARGLAPKKPFFAQTSSREGDWLSVDQYRLQFGPTLVGESAWKVVSAEVLAKKPAPGWSVVLGSVSYQVAAGASGGLWYDIRLDFVGSDGKEYSGHDELSPGGTCNYSLGLTSNTGNPAYDRVVVDPGVSPRFYPCVVVPDAAVDGGVWRVRPWSVTWKPENQYVEATGPQNFPFQKGLMPVVPFAAQTSNQQGDWLSIEQYRMQFGPTVVGEAAWTAVSAESTINKHPTAGWSLVLGDVVFQNGGSTSGVPHFYFLVDFVGNDGKIYKSDSLSPGGHCGYLSGFLYGQIVPAGAYSDFTPCAVVPDSAIAGGVWRVVRINPFLIPALQFVEARS